MKTEPNDAAYGKNGESSYSDYSKKHSFENVGLTKREYFAAIAMQGLLSTNGSYFPDSQNTGDLTATASVKYADALIEALNKDKK